jgi:hypothetical protein
MALDNDQILSVVSSELRLASGGEENDSLDGNRQAALAAYLGQKSGNEKPGRSSVVSTDVADAIEWILPEIVKAFTQSNDIVAFDSVSKDDDTQAEIESSYVYDILMKDNEGFIVLHQFIKDALMQKNGFVKIYYSDDEKITTESYTGVSEIELEQLLSNENTELLEISSEVGSGEVTYDLKVKVKRKDSKINVVSVPPEEFRVNRMHNSVDLSNARFTAHVSTVTAGELIAQGYEKSLVDDLPSHQDLDDDVSYRFYMQDEIVYPNNDDTYDPSLRGIEISECYMRMDVNEDGIAELVKVTVVGGDNPNVLLDVEEISEIPFISSTCILMSHKLFGLSIYDRLREIQQQKTALWRSILDNMYLQNNQRTVVVENQVNIDDVLISRPGGIIRAKRLDAVAPYVTPPLGNDPYKGMDYLDQVRAGRSGVSPEGTISDGMMGDRVGSQGLERIMTQKEELVGLMIRVIAETGIKPICRLIRSHAMKHQDVIRSYKFQGSWVDVNPSTWFERKHTTIKVGTGTGSRNSITSALMNLMSIQKDISVQPGQPLVRSQETYKLVDDYCKISGLSGASKYFLDPNSEEGMAHAKQIGDGQAQQSEAQMLERKIMAESQAKIAEAEVQKAAANMESVYLKNQVDVQKNENTTQKQQYDLEISLMSQKLKEAESIIGTVGKTEELDYKYYAVDERTRVEMARINAMKEGKDGNE